MRREDTTSLVEGGKANDAILYVHSFHNFLTAATGTDKTKIRFYLASCTKSGGTINAFAKKKEKLQYFHTVDVKFSLQFPN